MSLVTICHVTRSVHVGITREILILSLLFFLKRNVYTLEITGLCACVHVYMSARTSVCPANFWTCLICIKRGNSEAFEGIHF